jgi:hypothetical protein
VEDFDLATIAITGVAPHGKSGAQWSLTLRIVPLPALDPSSRPVSAAPHRDQPVATSVPDEHNPEAPAQRAPSPAGCDAENPQP